MVFVKFPKLGDEERGKKFAQGWKGPYRVIEVKEPNIVIQDDVSKHFIHKNRAKLAMKRHKWLEEIDEPLIEKKSIQEIDLTELNPLPEGRIVMKFPKSRYGRPLRPAQRFGQSYLSETLLKRGERCNEHAQ